MDSPEGTTILRHSTAHVMAQAVKELFPETKATIGPAIETGFYYDFDYGPGFTEEDLLKIEGKMREIVDRDVPIAESELKREEAIDFFKKEGELQSRAGQRHRGREVSIYTQEGLPIFAGAPTWPPLADKGIQAPQPRRRVLARGREEQDAYEDIRHGLPEQRP